jgi:hypothetical protein
VKSRCVILSKRSCYICHSLESYQVVVSLGIVVTQQEDIVEASFYHRR